MQIVARMDICPEAVIKRRPRCDCAKTKKLTSFTNAYILSIMKLFLKKRGLLLLEHSSKIFIPAIVGFGT